MEKARLCDSALSGLRPGVAVPGYDRSRMETRIVHLGAGAFHRSHQAVYTDDAMAGGDTGWGILAANLRSCDVSHALTPQDGLYTLLVNDNGRKQARVIGSLKQVVCLGESRRLLQDQLAASSTQIVTLTITEKGYHCEPASGALDESQTDIQADLAAPLNPGTAIGLLAAAIYARKKTGARPFTILSCDNLPANGVTLRRVLERYLELAQPAFGDSGLLRHFLDDYACPSTMVDRITPALTQADKDDVRHLLGMEDAAPVVAEPFSQWVIEDKFSSARPAWENVGATFTHDVAAFEAMKLRLLNGSHSALAYLGGLAGYRTVAQAIQDPVVARFVQGLMDDASQTLSMPAGVRLGDYTRSLLQRFGNVSLNHLTAQIATDGSQKLPQRILEPIHIRLSQGLPIARHALVVAAWIRYLMGHDEQQGRLSINDPMAVSLTTAVSRAGTSADDLVHAVLAFRQIFDDDISQNPIFIRSVTQALQQLLSRGVLASVAALDSTETE